jgi:hypothetical protein
LAPAKVPPHAAQSRKLMRWIRVADVSVPVVIGVFLTRIGVAGTIVAGASHGIAVGVILVIVRSGRTVVNRHGRSIRLMILDAVGIGVNNRQIMVHAGSLLGAAADPVDAALMAF